MTDQFSQQNTVLDQVASIATEARPWLKFLGIMMIIFGVLMCLTCYGLLLGWLPIWLGVLLLQSGNLVTLASANAARNELVPMMQKLRSFFMIQGILVLISVVLLFAGFIAMAIFGAAFLSAFKGLR